MTSAAIPWLFGGISYTIPPAIVRRQRRDPLGLVFGEIGRGEGAAAILGALQDARRDLASIEGVAAVAGDRAERAREVRVAEDLAGRGRSAVRQVGGARVGFLAQQRHAAKPFERRDLRDGKSVLGVRDRGGQDRLERRLAELLVKRHPARHRARDGHRMNALLRHLVHAARGQEFDGGAGRRPAARVEAVHGVAGRVVDDGKQVAADAVHHRRDQAHHRVGGNRRVDGVPAAREHDGARLRRRADFPPPRSRAWTSPSTAPASG